MKIKTLLTTLPLAFLLVFGAMPFDQALADSGYRNSSRGHETHDRYDRGRHYGKKHNHKRDHRYERRERPGRRMGWVDGRRYERGFERRHEHRVEHRHHACNLYNHRHWRSHYHDTYGGIRFLFGVDLGNIRVFIRQ